MGKPFVGTFLKQFTSNFKTKIEVRSIFSAGRMRSSESIDEFSIGFGELVRVKLGGFHPSKLRDFDRAWFSARDGAVEEMKFHRLRRIVMRRCEKLIGDDRFDIELFAQLPS